MVRGGKNITTNARARKEEKPMLPVNVWKLEKFSIARKTIFKYVKLTIAMKNLPL